MLEGNMKKKAMLIFAIIMSINTFSIYAASYYYDDLNRLIRVEYDSGVCIQYQYDQAGNIVKVITTGGKEQPIIKPSEEEDNKGNEESSNNNEQDETSAGQSESNKESNTNTQENQNDNNNEQQNSNQEKHEVIFSLNQKVLWLNGEEISIDTATYISKNNRLMVPVRYIAYALNIPQNQIKWDGQSRVVTILGERKIEITVGREYMLVDSQKVMLNECAVIKDGRTFLPIGDICRAFNLQYTWDNTLKQLTVYSENK